MCIPLLSPAGGAGGLGDFALTLSGKPASAAVEVGENGGEFALAGEQLFMIPPAATARQLTVQTTPSAPFTVTLHGGDAGTVVLQSSGNADAVTFILPESTAGYRLTIVSTGTGNITVNLILTDAETVSTGAPSSAGSTDTLPVDADCVGMPNSGVNVRTGPGTDYAVISAIPTRTSVAVLGINANGGWYYVQLPNGRQGWILGVIMTIEGECEGLPTIPVSADARMAEMTETPTMTFTPTATMNTSVTPTPTATMNTSVTPTATMNTSVTPTPTATTDEMSTATYTPSFTPTGTENVSTATYTPSFTPTTSE